MKILLLNGPNLNLLGKRQPEIYGKLTLPKLEADLRARATEWGVVLECVQSNAEGALVDAVQKAAEQGVSGAVVNAGAYSHTSIALRDAFLGTGLPFVEVHISNIHAREPFRRQTLLSEVALGSIVGFGVQGYELALRGLLAQLKTD